MVQDEECSGQPSKGDHNQLILLKLHYHSTVIWHLQQIRKVKKLGIRGYFRSWLKIKRKSFWSVIFSYSTLQWDVSQLDCDLWYKVGFIQQPAMSSTMVGPRRSSRALPKAKLGIKIKMITVWWSAASLIYYSFLNPGKTITSENYAQRFDEMYRKLRCLQSSLVNRKDPVLLHDNTRPHITQPTLQKLNELGYEVLPHLPYSPDVSPTNY